MYIYVCMYTYIYVYMYICRLECATLKPEHHFRTAFQAHRLYVSPQAPNEKLRFGV